MGKSGDWGGEAAAIGLLAFTPMNAAVEFHGRTDRAVAEGAMVGTLAALSMG